MKTKTIDARTAYAEVLRAAEEIRSDAHETIATMSPGDVVRQGDIYITCLDGEPPGGVPVGTRQLAPGTTLGARHVVEGDCDVLRVPDAAAVAALRRVVPGADRVSSSARSSGAGPGDDHPPRARRPDPARRRMLSGDLSAGLEHRGDAPPDRLRAPRQSLVFR